MPHTIILPNPITVEFNEDALITVTFGGVFRMDRAHESWAQALILVVLGLSAARLITVARLPAS